MQHVCKWFNRLFHRNAWINQQFNWQNWRMDLDSAYPRLWWKNKRLSIHRLIKSTTSKGSTSAKRIIKLTIVWWHDNGADEIGMDWLRCEQIRAKDTWLRSIDRVSSIIRNMNNHGDERKWEKEWMEELPWSWSLVGSWFCWSRAEPCGPCCRRPSSSAPSRWRDAGFRAVARRFPDRENPMGSAPPVKSEPLRTGI